jgi:type VI secretion system protein ImpK
MNQKQTSKSFALQTASQMAAIGNYQAASSLLEILREEDMSNEVYLLRAKIFAQQGKFEEAINQWQEVLKKDPSNQEAREGVKKASRLKARPANKLFLRVKILYGFIFLLLVGLVAVFSFMAGRGSGNPGKIVSQEVIKLQEQKFQQIILKIDEKLQPLVNVHKPTPPEIEINVPGIIKKIDGSHVVLIFDKGLFDNGTNTLKPEAKHVLSLLGLQLRPYISKVLIGIIGHTDDLPLPGGSNYPDNESLGLARAATVIDELRRASNLPANMFYAAAGEYYFPYPNDTRENRVKNRTVEMQIFKIND